MNLGIGISLTNYRSVPTVALDPDAAIAELFRTGTPGVYYEGAWYDPSDSSTVWQDSAGTTPAGVGDPVGRIDDKSGNGNHATQTTSAARPVLQSDGADGEYLDNDQVDDRLVVTLPATTGTAVIATAEGTAAYGISVTGDYALLTNSISTVYTHQKDWYGAVIRDGALDGAEISSTYDYFDGLGAGPTGSAAYGSVTNFTSYWRDASWITDFPLIDTGAATNLASAWQNCSSLTSFPLIDTSAATNLFYAWLGCSSLTSFPLIDTSSATSLSGAWYGCSSLTSFPLINTSSAPSLSGAWYGCSSLTSFPLIDTSAATSLSNAWYFCSSLTSFPLIDTSSATSLSGAWQNCSSLTSFPLIDTSSATNLSNAWRGCSSLTSFPLIDTSSATNLSNAWYFCSSLTSFPAGMFDATPCTNFTNVFVSCALSQTSVDNILVSIDTAGTSNGTLNMTGGTSATPSATGLAAVANLQSRGWTVTHN